MDEVAKIKITMWENNIMGNNIIIKTRIDITIKTKVAKMHKIIKLCYVDILKEQETANMVINAVTRMASKIWDRNKEEDNMASHSMWIKCHHLNKCQWVCQKWTTRYFNNNPWWWVICKACKWCFKSRMKCHNNSRMNKLLNNNNSKNKTLSLKILLTIEVINKILRFEISSEQNLRRKCLLVSWIRRSNENYLKKDCIWK